MSNLPQQDSIVQYQADGVTDVFIYPFLSPLDSDMQVYVTPSGATPIPSTDIQTLNVDYSVQGAGVTDGGTITFLIAPPANGAWVTIARNVGASSNTNFANAATFNGANLDSAIERLTLLAQQSQTYNLYRNLSYRVNAELPLEASQISQYTQLPLLANNEIWKGSGDGVIATVLEENPDVSTLRSDLANDSPGTDGAGLIGFYDVLNSDPTTVRAFLNALPAYIAANTDTFKPGMMIDYASTSAPSGWLICNGAAVSRTTYANLFAAIGTTWGSGDGATTFNLPNLSRRVTLGSGGSATSPAFAGTTVGSTGGEEVHTMTAGELVNHVHNPAAGFTDFVGSQAAGVNSMATSGGIGGTATTGSAVGALATPFNVMQLGAVVLKIIKT